MTLAEIIKAAAVHMPEYKYDSALTHARHDPSHCLTPGLFRSLKKGDRKSAKLEIVYEYGNGRRIEFSGPEPLGADDLRVLQGLVAMAGPKGLALTDTPKTEIGACLRESLDLKFDAVRDVGIVLRGSYRALAKTIGYRDIEHARSLRECIERLWKVSIIVQSRGKRMGFRLLSMYSSDETEGKLCVALNPLIAQAVMGEARHIRINLEEVRNLKSDAARLMHQRLCGWIDAGKSGRVEIDTLCAYVWPDDASAETQKKRRQRIRAALIELAVLGWGVSEYDNGKYVIQRT